MRLPRLYSPLLCTAISFSALFAPGAIASAQSQSSYGRGATHP
jgi:hypothetical protein